MRIIRHPRKNLLHAPVVALGNFDGVHLGHQQVIKTAVKEAKKLGADSAVITFDPHPQEVIAPERGLRLLTTLQEREALIKTLGVSEVIVLKFDQHLLGLSAHEFNEKYLVNQLGVREVVVGYDYAFGRGRRAGIAELKKFGFKVVVVPAVKKSGVIAKSGKVRELLSTGDFKNALKILGHPYRLTGRVGRGDGRGINLGFPTANIYVDPRKLLPAEGVYAGFVGKKKCVVNIGSRPTFGAGKLQVEIHLLNFSGDLRGKTIRVDLTRRLRHEKQFADVEALKAQIRKDIARVRRRLSE
jgi:riboflavin kinase/FMN adenylyltransferase